MTLQSINLVCVLCSSEIIFAISKNGAKFTLTDKLLDPILKYSDSELIKNNQESLIYSCNLLLVAYGPRKIFVLNTYHYNPKSRATMLEMAKQHTRQRKSTKPKPNTFFIYLLCTNCLSGTGICISYKCFITYAV